MGLLRPEFKEQRALQNESRLVLRLADSEEQAFQCVLRQQQTKVFFSLTRKIEETLTNGRCDVGDRFAQDSDSIYGRMTLATRQIFAASQSSSIVALFSRKHSRRACIASSVPIFDRNLKQSATVLAGL